MQVAIPSTPLLALSLRVTTVEGIDSPWLTNGVGAVRCGRRMTCNYYVLAPGAEFNVSGLPYQWLQHRYFCWVCIPTPYLR